MKQVLHMLDGGSSGELGELSMHFYSSVWNGKLSLLHIHPIGQRALAP